MTSTQRVQDGLLPTGDPDVRIIADHVHSRTDRHVSAAAPPPPKSKSKTSTELNRAEIKRSGTGTMESVVQMKRKGCTDSEAVMLGTRLPL